MTTIRITIHGRAQQKGSKQAFLAGGRAHLRDSNKRAMPWQHAVSQAAGQQYDGPALTCPVRLNVWFLFCRPACHFGTGRNAGKLKPQHESQWYAKTPDVDKMVRTLCDGLQGVVFTNDSLVVSCNAVKQWAKSDLTMVEIVPVEGACP